MSIATKVMLAEVLFPGTARTSTKVMQMEAVRLIGPAVVCSELRS